MDTVHVVEILKAQAERLRERGVEKLGLYGSTARGEATALSDIDLLLTLRPRSLSLLDLVALQEEFEALLGQPVDLTTTPITNPYLAREIARDMIGVF
jgi:predicted nucleotidyltransferase